MAKLLEKRCKPCEGGAEPLSIARAQTLQEQVPGWRFSANGGLIHRRFEFSNFDRTLAFINGLAWIANREGHHPDFRAGYDYCEVSFTTHAVGGLTENDFICAYRVDALLEK